VDDLALRPDGTVGGSAALCATGLSKRYGDRVAVDSVDLELPQGTVHGLLGPNGAGKSTVLRMLLGLVRPDQGTIAVAGEPLPHDAPRGLHGLAGFVDAPSFYPYLTASRNLELLSAWDGAFSHGRVEELLRLVGLSDRAQSKVRGFSTGMRQRLGLAAALISDPDVLIVDEPTSGLDPAAVRDLHALLLAIAGSGRTVLLSSHDLDEVERLCAGVTVLREGTVMYAGTIAALRDRAGERVWSLDTSENDTALLVAADDNSLRVGPGPSGGLQVRGSQPDFDRYVVALAAGGVAVRELVRDTLSFETLYFQLTEQPGPATTTKAAAWH
jgi:ABC-2 type transport system ATP-binding protein